MWNERLRIAARALCLALPGLVAALAARAAAQDDRNLELQVGDQTTLSAIGVERYSEGVPGVVDIRVTEREFIIAALRPGQTSLVLFYENGRQVRYRIRVRQPGEGDARPGSVEQRETVRLDMYFVELNESYGHSLGVGFPGTIGGPNVGTGSLDFTHRFTDPAGMSGPTEVVIQTQLGL
ncbi:MAG TPA: pilus assembly protein N-terminal domain-containing protein, partial [Sandaracinaceae bacterium]